MLILGSELSFEITDINYNTTEIMKKSNIFVYIELSKLVESLTTNVLLSKQHLKAQAGYFQLIPSRYFSDNLYPEWESICNIVKHKGPKKDESGRIIQNAVANTIDQMSPQECVAVANRILLLFEKVKAEVEYAMPQADYHR